MSNFSSHRAKYWGTSVQLVALQSTEVADEAFSQCREDELGFPSSGNTYHHHLMVDQDDLAEITRAGEVDG